MTNKDLIHNLENRIDTLQQEKLELLRDWSNSQSFFVKAVKQLEIQIAEREVRIEELLKSCPCAHIEPCSETCTCANPVMSGGCERCCTYGSPEQQIKKAKHLARAIDANSKEVVKW